MKTVSVGQRFGRLVTVERIKEPGKLTMWRCICDCGNGHTLRQTGLTYSGTKSCGCLSREVTQKLMTTHGGYKTPEYHIWAGMRNRCKNPSERKYHLYGGRGISVCERWESFENFIADMGARPTTKHSIDRIDTNGNYEPSNCRWATPKEQANNMRANHAITFRGETKNLSQWCDELGLKQKRVSSRLRSGWTVEDAFTTDKLARGVILKERPLKQPKTCSIEGCDKLVDSRGMCSGHYQRQQATKRGVPPRLARRRLLP